MSSFGDSGIRTGTRPVSDFFFAYKFLLGQEMEASNGALHRTL
jgi:hypothetical protein